MHQINVGLKKFWMVKTKKKKKSKGVEINEIQIEAGASLQDTSLGTASLAEKSSTNKVSKVRNTQRDWVDENSEGAERRDGQTKEDSKKCVAFFSYALLQLKEEV